MASILTNTAALAALQTLRTLSSGLEETQQRVASGLRVETAADNAAYWSIATTMRSDGRALSSVQDALGMGAALADVAYTGTSSIVDILSEFKARLVAAKEPGVDKSKVQKELVQLNQQVETIVGSSSFSGESWLKTSVPTHLMETGPFATNVVSSFVRTPAGSVSVQTVDVNLKTTSMLNEGGGGILQKELWGVGDIGGFRGTNINSVAHQGHETHVFTGPATFSATDFVQFTLVIDAGAHTAGVTQSGLRIDRAAVNAALGVTDGTINSAEDMRNVLNHIFAAASVPATANEVLFSGSVTNTRLFEIASLETSGHPGSSIDVTVTSTSWGGAHPPGFGLGLEDPPESNHDNMYPQASISFTKPFTVSPKSEIYFDVQVGPGMNTTYKIDKPVVDAALGTTDGAVTNAVDLAKVIEFVSAGSGLKATPSGNTITFAADQTIYPEAGNRAARVAVGDVWSIPTWALEFNLDEVDITQSLFTIDEYITGVEYMLQRSISSASLLGSLQKRIEMQAGFATTLSDVMKTGVGRLVDADMNEESTRLKALQTQEQLARQSLQIANTNAENILALFE